MDDLKNWFLTDEWFVASLLTNALWLAILLMAISSGGNPQECVFSMFVGFTIGMVAGKLMIDGE